MNIEASRTTILKSFVIVLAILLIFCVIKKVKASTVYDNNHKELTCISLKIEENDTLWDIANQYYTDDYDNIYEYINTIMETNNMYSDVIHTGNYIIVPYYD